MWGWWRDPAGVDGVGGHGRLAVFSSIPWRMNGGGGSSWMRLMVPAILERRWCGAIVKGWMARYTIGYSKSRKTVNDLRLSLSLQVFGHSSLLARGNGRSRSGISTSLFLVRQKPPARFSERGGLEPAPSGRHEQRPNQRRTNQTTTSTNFTKWTHKFLPLHRRGNAKKTKKQTKTKITAHVNECCACTLPHFYTRVSDAPPTQYY
jgi:hypothetical protein